MRGRRPNQARAREYLSRLAEPVFPGEQALAARPVRMGWSREVAAPREEIVPWRETPSWQLREEPGMEPRMAPTPWGEDEALRSGDRADLRAETSAARLAAGDQQRESQADRTPLPAEYHTAHMQTGLRAQKQASSLEEKQSIEPLPRTLLREEEQAEKAESRRHPAESEPSPQIPGAPRTETMAIRAKGSRAANLPGSEGKQSESRANAASPSLEASRDRISIQMPREERSTDASSSNKHNAPKDQNGPTNRNARESGTRVTIGTVEVRTVLRQQAPSLAPVAAPQPMPADRTTGSNAGPLARGLGWRFGLVQG